MNSKPPPEEQTRRIEQLKTSIQALLDEYPGVEGEKRVFKTANKAISAYEPPTTTKENSTKSKKELGTLYASGQKNNSTKSTKVEMYYESDSPPSTPEFKEILRKRKESREKSERSSGLGIYE